MITQLKILGTKIDLFEDENINVIDSVVDIKDITKNNNVFTLDFTVPASRINNRLFGHWYDANINNAFDARKKQSAEILLDGISFKEGFVQLSKVNISKGVAASYSINFSGRLTGIKKSAKDLTLQDLDLSAFDHSYDAATVKTGLSGSLFSGDLVYAPIVKKQYYVEEDGTAQNTSKLQNISYFGAADNGIIWRDLRPSLKLLPIIEAIESKLGVNFSRNFFDTSEFSELFMWLSPSSKKEIEGETKIINFTSKEEGSFMDLATNTATFPCDANDNRAYECYIKVFPKAGFESVPYTIKMYLNGELDFTLNVPSGFGENSPVFTFFSPSGAQDQVVYFEVQSSEDFEYNSELTEKSTKTGITWKSFGDNNSINADFIVANEIPNIKIIDFLKGLFSMYKLIVIPTAEDSYYINTLDAYYSEGGLYDVTKYVDFEKFDVNRGTILNEISFKFKDPKTINNILYKQLNGDRGFGDEELIVREDPSDNTSEQIDGKSFKLELPFEQVVFERLIDATDPNTISAYSTVVYGRITDESGEPVNIEPMLHYIDTAKRLSKSIGFIDNFGTKTLLGDHNIPSHTNTRSNPEYSTTFSSEQSIYTNVYMSNTLYTNHYKDYIDGVFNVKKREYKHKAYLPINIVTKLQLNDLLKIKDDYYRINKYSYNLLTGETELDLINFFGDVSIEQTRSSTQNINTDYKAKTINTYIYNLGVSTFNKVEIDGAGTDWVNISNQKDAANMLPLEIDSNTGFGSTRSMYFDIVGKKNTDRILIRQTAGALTVDSNIITSDNNIITSDNGNTND